MLSATLTFAQTHHCDITETILCCWEVPNLSKAKGEIRPRWHVKDTLNTVIFMRKQYHLIIMRDQNPPPPMTNMLNGLTTSTLSSWGVIMRHLLRTMLSGEITPAWSSWGIKISHPLWTIRWLRDINSGQTSRLQRTCLNTQTEKQNNAVYIKMQNFAKQSDCAE